MDITFSLPHVFHPESNPEDNAYALQILLDMLVRQNMAYLRNHAVPPLYRSGVVYGRTKVWDTIPALYARRVGDCKSLSCARVAELKLLGHEARPVFRFAKTEYGKHLFHILLEKYDANGRIVFEDPSRLLGMGLNELSYFPDLNATR